MYLSLFKYSCLSFTTFCLNLFSILYMCINLGVVRFLIYFCSLICLLLKKLHKMASALEPLIPLLAFFNCTPVPAFLVG